MHSEFNPSPTEPVQLLQIWILPEQKGLKPSYEQHVIPAAEKRGRLRLVASRDGRDGSVMVHQDVNLYAALLGAGDSVKHPLHPGRHSWVQVASGAITLNGHPLSAGDGAAISYEEVVELTGTEPAEILLFDLA